MAKEERGRIEVDVKRYAKVEKIPGGEMEECVVMDGVMFNKDVTHSSMRRKIDNPRVVLLDCPLGALIIIFDHYDHLTIISFDLYLIFD